MAKREHAPFSFPGQIHAPERRLLRSHDGSEFAPGGQGLWYGLSVGIA